MKFSRILTLLSPLLLPVAGVSGCASMAGYSALEVTNGCSVTVRSAEKTEGLDEQTNIRIDKNCEVTFGDDEKADDAGPEDMDKKD
jgi:hypothetical protein